MCGRKMFTMWVLINAAREMIDVYWMEINNVYYVGKLFTERGKRMVATKTWEWLQQG